MCLVGLKFRHPETNKLRGVRIQGEAMFPPAEEGWGIHTYFCVRYGIHTYFCVRYGIHTYRCVRYGYPHLFLCKLRVSLHIYFCVRSGYTIHTHFV